MEEYPRNGAKSAMARKAAGIAATEKAREEARERKRTPLKKKVRKKVAPSPRNAKIAERTARANALMSRAPKAAKREKGAKRRQRAKAAANASPAKKTSAKSSPAKANGKLVGACEVCAKATEAVCEPCFQRWQKTRRGPRLFYCSKQCQMEDWRQGHFKVCAAAVEARAQREAKMQATAARAATSMQTAARGYAARKATRAHAAMKRRASTSIQNRYRVVAAKRQSAQLSAEQRRRALKALISHTISVADHAAMDAEAQAEFARDDCAAALRRLNRYGTLEESSDSTSVPTVAVSTTPKQRAADAIAAMDAALQPSESPSLRHRAAEVARPVSVEKRASDESFSFDDDYPDSDFAQSDGSVSAAPEVAAAPLPERNRASSPVSVPISVPEPQQERQPEAQPEPQLEPAARASTAASESYSESYGDGGFDESYGAESLSQSGVEIDVQPRVSIAVEVAKLAPTPTPVPAPTQTQTQTPTPAPAVVSAPIVVARDYMAESTSDSDGVSGDSDFGDMFGFGDGASKPKATAKVASSAADDAAAKAAVAAAKAEACRAEAQAEAEAKAEIAAAEAAVAREETARVRAADAAEERWRANAAEAARAEKERIAAEAAAAKAARDTVSKRLEAVRSQRGRATTPEVESDGDLDHDLQWSFDASGDANSDAGVEVGDSAMAAPQRAPERLREQRVPTPEPSPEPSAEASFAFDDFEEEVMGETDFNNAEAAASPRREAAAQHDSGDRPRYSSDDRSGSNQWEDEESDSMDIFSS